MPTIAIALAAATLLVSPALAQRQKILPPGTGVPAPVFGPSTRASVLTYHNNNQRTGVNANETAFIPSGPSANLNAQVFGKIWSRAVDGTIHTQPLFVPGVQFPNAADVENKTLSNGVYNAVYVCTSHNSVYAFDAGQSAQISRPSSSSTAIRSTPLWRVSFNFAGGQIGPVPSTDVFSEDLGSEIGITGTPVIDCVTDPNTGYKSGTLYVVAKTKEGNGYAQRLHALDITTGRERTEYGSPVLIQASVAGTGDGSVLNGNSGVVNFDPLWENQQAGLTLTNPGTANAQLYVTWGSHGDNGPFHGWVLAFNPKNLQVTGVYNTSPNADTGAAGFAAGAGVYQGGSGPAVDENGNVFLATGVGVFDADPSLGSGTDFGNSVLKLQFPTGQPGAAGTVADYFTPNNWNALSTSGLDLGSGGVVVLPDVGNAGAPRLAVAAGTEGTIYLLNRDTGSMGKFGGAIDNIVQAVPNSVGPVFGVPAYFGGNLYYQGTGDFLKAFQFQNGFLNAVPASKSASQAEFPGTTPVITSSPDGSNGVVWTLERFTPPAILPGFGLPDPTPMSVLHAYDAANVARELYSGIALGNRDTATSSTFSVPTVANSRVYAGGVNEFVAYGFFNTNGVTPGNSQADHFVITGPTSAAQKAGNWYSITAIGPNGSPLKLTGSVHLSYRTFGGPTVNITTLNFNNQSNLLFQYAYMQSGVFEFYANDDFGHSTYVQDIDLMPSGTLFPETFVRTPNTNGPDHLVVRAPATAKVGAPVSVQVSVVTPNQTPFTWQMNGANFFVPNVTVRITNPNGTQGAIQGLPVYAYSTGRAVPFKIGSSLATIKVTVPSVGNHVVIVSGTVSFLFGTDPTAPTLTISYPLTGTATIIGLP